MACYEEELIPSLDIQERVGVLSYDVMDDDGEVAEDIEALPHVEAYSF